VNSLASAALVPVLDLSGKTTVQELAEVIRRAAVVVSADSGPVHIAAALEQPLVGLYGASLAPLMTAPWGSGHVFLVADRMDAFSPDLVLAAIRSRLDSSEDDLRRESVAAKVQAWRTAMLPAEADPLGGVTYLPVHADRLDGTDILRRIMRHVMACAIMKKDVGSMRHLISLAPAMAPADFGPQSPLASGEEQLVKLSADVGRALKDLRELRLDGLPTLADRVTATIDRLKQNSSGDPILSHAILFLDWKLRMMPPYRPVRVFRENRRELQRAARALAMARQAAQQIWPLPPPH
jgi:hypothetical protein